MRENHHATSQGPCKDPPRLRSLDVTLEVRTIPFGPEGLCPSGCLQCQGPLTIHQPDADDPDRLMGSCDDCGAWYAFAIGSDGTQAVVVFLPVHALLERALELD